MTSLCLHTSHTLKGIWMVYPASFFSTLDSKKYLMTYSSVAFAVPEYSLKKDIYESGYICYLS